MPLDFGNKLAGGGADSFKGLFAGVRSRLDSANIPESFKGLPVTLAAASIVSMSFMGFAGVVDKLFA